MPGAFVWTGLGVLHEGRHGPTCSYPTDGTRLVQAGLNHISTVAQAGKTYPTDRVRLMAAMFSLHLKNVEALRDIEIHRVGHGDGEISARVQEIGCHRRPQV